MNGESLPVQGGVRGVVSGHLTEWHDAKGYGWIAASDKRVFAHIKEFEFGQRRPVARDEVIFTPGTDEQCRIRAH